MENAKNVTEKKLLYNSFSLCPRCALVDRSGLNLKPSEVFVEFERVWLSLNCTTHGIQRTLVCSDAKWWTKMTSYANDSAGLTTLTDMEDLKKKRKLRPSTLPLVVEFSLFSDQRILSNNEIEAELKKVNLMYPKDVQFILKVSGNLSDDMAQLNERVLFLASQTRARVLVQLSFERLSILAHLENSCFLKDRIYPSVEYYIAKGQERECVGELGQLFRDLKSFEGIRLSVSILIETPWPDLSSILTYLRAQVGFVRFIELGMKRSPSAILADVNHTLKCAKKSRIPVELQSQMKLQRMDVYDHTLDPLEVINLVRDATGGTIAIDDFFPMSFGSVIEPFLPMAGYGRYRIRPSPLCGFAVALVTTKKQFSIPISRLMDLDKLRKELTPMLPDLLKDDIGILTLGKLKSAVESCKKPGTKLPSLISFILDKSKLEKTQRFLDQSQVLLIHNNMDLATLDMARRCDCASLSKGDEGLVASCNGCF